MLTAGCIHAIFAGMPARRDDRGLCEFFLVKLSRFTFLCNTCSFNFSWPWMMVSRRLTFVFYCVSRCPSFDLSDDFSQSTLSSSAACLGVLSALRTANPSLFPSGLARREV